MKSSKLKLAVMLMVLGILLFRPARCFGVCHEEEHFINEAILESCSTYVNNPDTGPHGDEPNLYVGDVIPADAGVCRSFLKFELPALAPGSTVVYAQLCLYCNESEPAGRKRTIGVHSVPPAVVWDEDALWNSPPGFASSYNPVPTDTITSEFWPGWCYWDVTADVNQTYGMGFDTYSVAVKVEGEPDYVWNCFYCKGLEQPPPPDPNLYHPRLILATDSGRAVIASGSEGWVTGDLSLTARSSMEFGGDSNLPGIKDEFFGPGSDPFDGCIFFSTPFDTVSGTCDDADTVIERMEGVALPPGEPCEVPIELIELNLVSIEPIKVTFNGGITETLWDVDVSLDPVYPAVGQMTITKSVDTPGGIFQYHDLTFGVEFVFTDVNSGIQKTLNITTHPDFGEPMAIISHPPYEWRQTTDKQEPPCGYDGFYAYGEEPLYIELMYGIVPGLCGELYWSPPKPVNPQFALLSLEDWQTALLGGNIEPMGEQEGEEHLQDINDNLVDGNSYPDANFLPPSGLYVYEGNEVPEPNDGGLVMPWGDPCATMGEPGHLEDGDDYASAWVYEYDKDPDLSNCTITITVYPPGGINTVSLGLQDVFGNIRVWLWDVGPGGSGKPLTEDVSNKVTIDLSRTGRSAASPRATSYSNTPGFDITKVAKISFDENSTFVAATQVPPPGQTDPTPWNYWTNLLVTIKTPPLPATSKYYPKWSQRPEVIDANQPNLLLGWNEFSNYYWRPIAADDWQCTDDRPITDLHWWGSFLWWTQPYVPPVMPQAFHIGIWTDVPAGLDPNFPFSHPGYLIWENYCDNYVWSFAGYDTFPGLDPNLPKESCFQFNQLLSEDEWFYQDPNAPWDMDGDPNSAVYWLSVAAIYDPTQPPPMYPWGWKTRKPSWNDDAVQIWGVEYPPVDWPAGFPPPSWPPSPGSYWKAGTPIEYPAGVSWDMAFELTTNEPDPNKPVSADLNYDGIVNFRDFAIFANQWLLDP